MLTKKSYVRRALHLNVLIGPLVKSLGSTRVPLLSLLLFLFISPFILFNAHARRHQQQQLEKVSIRLDRDGFVPAASVRQAGSFLLKIDNRSDVTELNLRLSHDGGERVLDYSVPAGAEDFSQEIDLAAGEYTLKEINHPAWLFHITVQQQ